jgi:hypothetical protein
MTQKSFVTVGYWFAALVSKGVLTDKMRQNFINVTNDFIQV